MGERKIRDLSKTQMKLTLPLSGLITSFALVPVSCVYAQDASSIAATADGEKTMIVSAAASSGLSALDTLAAVSVNYGDDIRHAAPRINRSEGLVDVPGLQIQNRQNFAQDLQMSIVVSARDLPLASADSDCTWTVFRRPCRMARGTSPILILARLNVSMCCAGRSPRFMVRERYPTNKLRS